MSTAALAGSTKRKQRLKMAGHNSERGGARGRYKYVSYCPDCQPVSVGDPEQNVHVGVTAATRFAVCRMGHRWAVRI